MKAIALLIVPAYSGKMLLFLIQFMHFLFTTEFPPSFHFIFHSLWPVVVCKSGHPKGHYKLAKYEWEKLNSPFFEKKTGTLKKKKTFAAALRINLSVENRC